MKKYTGIVLFVVVLSLIITVLLGLTAMAEQDGALEVKALNVAYGDKTQILIAVDIANTERDNVEVTYQYNGDTYVAALHPEITYSPSEGEEYPVFYTVGIAAKDMADEIEVEAHIKGSEYTPVYSSTSVASYFYTRLYVDNIINAEDGTDDARRAKLYLSCLEYGANAQDVLINIENEKNGTDPETLVNTLAFVWCDEGATVNGADISALVTPGTVITPTSSATVAGFDAVDKDGNVVATVGIGDSYTVTGSVKLVPTKNMIQTFEDGKLCNGYLTSTLYGADNVAVDIKDVTDMSLYANYTTLSIAEDPANAANKVLKVVNKGRDSGSTASTAIGFTNADPAGNCFVFETKIYAESIVAGYCGTQLMFVNGKGSTLTLCIFRDSAANGGGLYITSGGTYAVPAGTRLAEELTLGSWFSLRAEYYHDGAKASTETTFLKLYINDSLVFDGKAYYSGGNLKSEIAQFKISHYRNGNSTIYYDNMSFTRIDKEYVASTVE